ncbi:hypothetical protein ElyMa_004385200 [Elysia marginata]|uniref:Uncharacterized protein n=1 Tax=Elysia marginata TaxID=1093978 RepID=A0AAV4H7I0_9GAST|nr:hypothetical protein ElyMa_004385200 [Elysia marginata]
MPGMLRVDVVAFLWLIAAVATSSTRERRFLLDVTDGARDIQPLTNKGVPFSWDVGDHGRKLSVTDRGAVHAISSNVTDVAYDLMRWGFWLHVKSETHRSHVVLHPDDKHLDKWKVRGKYQHEMDG